MLTALINIDAMEQGDWVALWQRVKPLWNAGYMLMARRIPLTVPSSASYVFESYERNEVPRIERTTSDGSDRKPTWLSPEWPVLSMVADATWLYFLVDRGADDAVYRVKLDGTGLEEYEAFADGVVSHGPNALMLAGGILYKLNGEAVSAATDGTYAYFMDTKNPTVIWREVLGSGEPEEWFTMNEIEEGEGGEGQLKLYEEPSILKPAAGESGQDVCVSPDGKNVYLLLFNGGIVQYARDLTTGQLTALEPEAVLGEAKGAQQIVMSADGAFVYVAIGGGGEDIAVLSRNAGTGLLTFVETQGFGFETVVTSMAISPDGLNAYATTFIGVENVLVQFSRNPGTGKLTALEPFQALNVGEESELDKVCISPDGKSVYVPLSETITRLIYQFSRNSETGLLSPIGSGHVKSPVEGDAPENVVVSPDGKNVYVSLVNEGLLQYARNLETGALAPLAPAHVEGPGGLALGISSDGLNVYKVNRAENSSIAQYARDPETGLLAALEPSETPSVEGSANFVWSVALSPDDKSAYLAVHPGTHGGVVTYFRQPWTPPIFSLDKGMACDGVWLYFSGVGPLSGSIGRIRVADKEQFSEALLPGKSGVRYRGPLAHDDTLLYFTEADGAIGRMALGLFATTPERNWQPKIAPSGVTPHGLATAPKPVEAPGELELRIEKRLGGQSLLASKIVAAGEGWRELGFDIDGEGHLSALLDGVTQVTTLDPTTNPLLGGYVGIEGTRGLGRGVPTSGGPGIGKLPYRLDAATYFDPYATDTTPHKTWMADKIARAISYTPIIAYISRFPSTLFLWYFDVWTGDALPGEGKVQIDKASGRKVVLETIAAKVGEGIEGLFMDDLNFAGGNRPTEEPESKAWKEGLGLLAEEIRAAHPTIFLEANPQYHDIWPLIKGGKALPLAPGSEAADPDVERAVQAVDMFCKEFGIGPTSGIASATDYREVMEYAEWLHSRGVGLQWSADKEASEALDEYQLATALLVADGHDSTLAASKAHPEPGEVWFKGQDMGFGEPTGEREHSEGLWKRTFTNGVVYTVAPEGAEHTVTLTEAMVNSKGVTLPVGTKITLTAKQGLLLLKAETEAEAATDVIGLRQFTMDGVLLDALERSESPLSNGGKWTRQRWTLDSGYDSGAAGWQASSFDSGAYWNAAWFGALEPEAEEKEEPEAEEEEPTPVLIATDAGGGAVPFSAPVRR